MNVIALSDLHGNLPDINDKFDLMLICGDICPVYTHGRSFQKEWLMDDFVEWVNKTYDTNEREGSMIVLIAGNHDFVFEGMSVANRLEFERACHGHLKYLDNEEFTFYYMVDGLVENTYRIFGCPYCKPFGNWAFMRENLQKYYDFIPEGLDFLISHDAADINELGLIKKGRYKGTNAGNTPLAEKIREVKPKYYFCGHIHSGRHELNDIDGTISANVSMLDESYNVTYSPLCLSIL